MEGFVVRVAAHYGEPKQLGKIFACSGIVLDTPVDKTNVVNDLRDFESMSEAVDRVNNGTSDYTLDKLVDDFQDEYGCKVNIELEPHVAKDGILVYEFDIFEPNWPEKDEAEDVINDLTRRVVDWVNGYPMGR